MSSRPSIKDLVANAQSEGMMKVTECSNCGGRNRRFITTASRANELCIECQDKRDAELSKRRQ